MEIRPVQTEILNTEADVLVVGVLADAPLADAATQADEALHGAIRRMQETKDISSKVGDVATLLAPTGLKAAQLLVVGLGEREKLDAGAAFRAVGAAAKKAAEHERGSLAFFLPELSAPAQVEAGVAGAIIASQGQDLYRAQKRIFPPKSILWSGGDADVLARGEIIGSSMNLTRRLVNAPADEIYPESFSDEAGKVAGECGLEIDIWDRARLEAERCGSLLAVAKGSAREPRLVMLRYRGAGDAPPLAIVGKGVTFDSGGLSLKPSEGMLTMKCDMAGAATMLGALRAIALLKLPINVLGLAGLVENMTGPAAFKLGDVLTARNGTTIEVHNTDAEGRLVLADVLDVAVTSGAARILDLATLTGACVVALGNDVAGVMTNNQAWCDVVLQAARTSGELVWQLPMFPEYDELITSQVADIKNVGEGRWGGAITAAKFLQQFVGDVPWTHVDIAGPAFREKPKAWCDAGASGELVRTLVEVARGGES